jgi:hypothetical protein
MFAAQREEPGGPEVPTLRPDLRPETPAHRAPGQELQKVGFFSMLLSIDILSLYPRNIALFPHVCGKCLVGFRTAAKLCNHVANKGRCKVPPVAATVGSGEVPAVGGEVPAGGGDDIVTQLNQLADQVEASVPGGFGDIVIQPMDLGQDQGPIILRGSDNLEEMLAAGGPPVTVIVNPDEADGSFHLQPM